MPVAKGTVEISRENARKIIAELPALLGPNAVVFDIETTGLNSRWHEIVSFAAKSPTDAVGTSTFIMPKRPKDLLKANEGGKSAYDINGIHPDDLVGSPTFQEAYPIIRQALQGKHWVCWNAEFDVKFLDDVCDKRGLERIPRAGVTCAMKLLSPLAGLRGQRRGQIVSVQVSETADDRFRWQKLSSLAKRMGIDTRKAHDANADVDITISVMKWASEILKSLPQPRKSKPVRAQEMAEITFIYSREGKNGQYWVLQPDHDVEGEAFLFENQLGQKRFAKCESFIAWLKSMPTGCISLPPANVLIQTKFNSQGYIRVASLQCEADVPQANWRVNVRRKRSLFSQGWQAGRKWTNDLNEAVAFALEQDGYAYIREQQKRSTIETDRNSMGLTITYGEILGEVRNKLKISADERKQILNENIILNQTGDKRLESSDGFQAVFVTQKKTNHILHLILSLVTGGLWLPLWILLALTRTKKREVLRVDEYGTASLEPAKS